MQEKKSVGIAFIWNNQILLTSHPKDEEFQGTISIPKGRQEEGEMDMFTAIREVKEEINIDVPIHWIINNKPHSVFTDSGREIVYYIVYIDELSHLGMNDGKTIIHSSNYQTDEVIWSGFMPFDMAWDNMYPCQRDILIQAGYTPPAPVKKDTFNDGGEAGNPEFRQEGVFDEMIKVQATYEETVVGGAEKVIEIPVSVWKKYQKTGELNPEIDWKIKSEMSSKSEGRHVDMQNLTLSKLNPKKPIESFGGGGEAENTLFDFYKKKDPNLEDNMVVGTALIDKAISQNSFIGQNLIQAKENLFFIPSSIEERPNSFIDKIVNYDYFPKPNQNTKVGFKEREAWEGASEKDKEILRNNPKVFIYDSTLIDANGKIANNEYELLSDKKELFSSEVDSEHLFRGMSQNELSYIAENGFIKSNAQLNIGKQQADTTSFAQYPSQATNYAHGFTAWYDTITFEEPKYIVKVQREGLKFSPTLENDPDNEVDVFGKIPSSNISDIYEIRLGSSTKGFVALIDNNQWSNEDKVSEGSRTPMHQKVYVRKLSAVEVDYIRLEEGGVALSEGTKIEMEHKDTIEKIKKGNLSTEESAELIAKDHLDERSDYYDVVKRENLEDGGSVSEEAQQLIDIIDIDPSNERYSKYIPILKEKYQIDYVEPSVRYKKDNDLVEKYIGIKKLTTNKGVDITMDIVKTPNIDGSLTMTVFDDSGNQIASAGYGIDLTSKTIRVGGVQVVEYMRRKGVYSAMMDEIENISKENNLKMQEKGRSQDAQDFWESRKKSDESLEDGGVIEGQLHSECNDEDGCGVKFTVGDGGKQIEAERDEAVIVSEAFEKNIHCADDNCKYEMEGTPSQIASAINVLGGGKNFDKGATIKDSDGKTIDLPKMKTEASDTDVESHLESGSIIINRRSMAMKEKMKVSGTTRQIASAINSVNGNGVVIEQGASVN